MNKSFPSCLNNLIEEFAKMPGIGPRSAERMAFFVLQSHGKYADKLARSIEEVISKIGFCHICNNLSEGNTCSICKDNDRDKTIICVVEAPSSITAIEKGRIFDGVYHVLLGALSPLDGVGPDDIKINGLIKRVKKDDIKEVIIATDFTTEGETTSLFIHEVLKSFNIKLTRLARGVPVGAILEYADTATLQRAFEERRSE